MKLAEIKAVLHAKAKAAKIVGDAAAASVQSDPPANFAPLTNSTTPAKTKEDKSTRKKTDADVNETMQQPTIAKTPPQQAVQQIPPTPEEDIESIVGKYLRPGLHYAVIPHTSKPSLLKGGAEKLCAIFGFRVSCEIVNRIEHFDHANPDNSFVQYESKVIVYNRYGKKISEGYGSCNSAESKFIRQPFANRVNTVLKMSKKRAYVDAILTATCASSVFTQDMEDIANFQDSK